MRIVKPSIYDEFECVGKECIFTCCGGWGIPVEEEIYTNCGEYEDNMEYDTGLNIYKIKMDHKGLCPFLDEAQLCTLVLKGKELCTTCREFPRMCVITTEKEKSLMLDCPQVVALLEKLKEPLAFLTEDDGKTDCNKNENAEMILMNDIKFRITAWLQKRKLPLWYRIFFTVLCLNKIDQMTEKSDIENELQKMLSEQYYETMMMKIDSIYFDRRKQFEEIRNIIIQLNGFLLLPLIDDKFGSRGRALYLMAKNQNCDFKEYQEAYHKWKKEKVAEFDVLLENVIVYQWFQYSSQGINLMRNNFFAILLEFLLIRHFSILSYAIGRSNEPGELRFYIALASRAVRIRKDNSDYNEWLGEMEKGILSTANLYCLLK